MPVRKLTTGTLRGKPRLFRQNTNGEFLTRDESRACYALIRHNVRTYESAGVVQVIHGKANAEATMKQFKESQSSADGHEGWRYFLEKTELRAGMNPAEATNLRQRDLEIREAKELEK